MTAPASLRTLRRFLPRPRVEGCELCGASLPKEHSHLLDVESHRLTCACEACSVLFAHRGAATYRRVGRDVRRLADFVLTDAEWEALRIPIGLVFFVKTDGGEMKAFYPGPAGPAESLLAFPVLIDLEPEIEALLVNRVGAAREHYIVPIDRCYELVGLIRLHWRGLSGGEEVWREIGAYFARLQEAAGA